MQPHDAERVMEPPSIGIEINEAHYPHRTPIDAYGDGGFRFAGMSHRGSLICVPSGIYAWGVDDWACAKDDDFAKIFEEASDIDILLVGTGESLVPISDILRAQCREHGISADSMATGAAVRTFNVLVAEGRQIAAVFVAV